MSRELGELDHKEGIRTLGDREAQRKLRVQSQEAEN